MARVNLEYLQSSLLVGDLDLNLPIEPSGAPQRGVDRVRPVCGCDNDDLPSRLEAVHQGEQLADDPPLDFASHFLSLRSDRVDLVDEDYRRRLLLRLLENLSQPRLRFTVEFAHYLRPAYRYEVGVALSRDGLREEGLPRSRRTVEEDPLRRLDAQLLEDLRVSEGELDHLPDFLNLVLEATYVFVSYLRNPAECLSLLGDYEDGPLGDQGRIRRGAHPDNLECQAATKVRNHDVVPLRDRHALEGIGEVPLIYRRDRLKRSHDDLLRRGCLHLLDDDDISYRYARIISNEAVYPDDTPPLVGGVEWEALRDCPPLSLYLNHVASGGIECIHGIIVYPSNTPADVSCVSLKDFQLDLLLAHA